MFAATYKNTIKNLLRSPSFWMVVLVGAVYGIYLNVMKSSYGYVDMETFEMIWDTDPRYVLDFQSYAKLFANMADNVTIFSTLLLCAVSTTAILMRDYGDRFFEIEKSAGTKTGAYVYGRYTAIVTINAIYAFVLLNICLFGYVFTRGGLDGYTVMATVADAFVRLIYLELYIVIPAILVSVAITYGIGALFGNGVSAAVGGTLYCLVYMIIGRFFSWQGGEIMDFIRSYISPVPQKVFFYMYYFRTEWEDMPLETFGTSAEIVAICIGALVTVSALLTLTVYIKTKKRTV